MPHIEVSESPSLILWWTVKTSKQDQGTLSCCRGIERDGKTVGGRGKKDGDGGNRVQEHLCLCKWSESKCLVFALWSGFSFPFKQWENCFSSGDVLYLLFYVVLSKTDAPFLSTNVSFSKFLSFPMLARGVYTYPPSFSPSHISLHFDVLRAWTTPTNFHSFLQSIWCRRGRDGQIHRRSICDGSTVWRIKDSEPHWKIGCRDLPSCPSASTIPQLLFMDYLLLPVPGGELSCFGQQTEKPLRYPGALFSSFCCRTSDSI